MAAVARDPEVVPVPWDSGSRLGPPFTATWWIHETKETSKETGREQEEKDEEKAARVTKLADWRGEEQFFWVEWADASELPEPLAAPQAPRPTDWPPDMTRELQRYVEPPDFGRHMKTGKNPLVWGPPTWAFEHYQWHAGWGCTCLDCWMPRSRDFPIQAIRWYVRFLPHDQPCGACRWSFALLVVDARVEELLCSLFDVAAFFLAAHNRVSRKYNASPLNAALPTKPSMDFATLDAQFAQARHCLSAVRIKHSGQRTLSESAAAEAFAGTERGLLVGEIRDPWAGYGLVTGGTLSSASSRMCTQATTPGVGVPGSETKETRPGPWMDWKPLGGSVAWPSGAGVATRGTNVSLWPVAKEGHDLLPWRRRRELDMDAGVPGLCQRELARRFFDMAYFSTEHYPDSRPGDVAVTLKRLRTCVLYGLRSLILPRGTVLHQCFARRFALGTEFEALCSAADTRPEALENWVYRLWTTQGSLGDWANSETLSRAMFAVETQVTRLLDQMEAEEEQGATHTKTSAPAPHMRIPRASCNPTLADRQARVAASVALSLPSVVDPGERGARLAQWKAWEAREPAGHRETPRLGNMENRMTQFI